MGVHSVGLNFYKHASMHISGLHGLCRRVRGDLTEEKERPGHKESA